MENSLQEFVNSKKTTQETYEYRSPYGPNVSQFEGDMEEVKKSSGKRKKSIVDKYFAPRNTQRVQHSMRSGFFYDACIPTNDVNSLYFKPILDVRCTIMGDGCIDNRQRTLINFLVYCLEGISFVKSVDALDIVKDLTNLFLLFDEVIEWVGPLNVVHIVTDNATNYHKHINWSLCAAHCLNLIFKDIGKMDHVAELENFCNKPTIIGGVMDVIDQKILKGKLETMNEMKLFCDRLGSFGRDLAYSSREVLQPDEWWRLHRYNAPHLQKLAIQILSQTASSSRCERNWSVFERIHTKRRNRLEHQRFYNKKRIYDPINYACIDETDFWIVDDYQLTKLDIEELENLLYEEGSIPINEVEGSSSHIDDEDGGGVAIEELDVENFGFPDAHFQSPYSNFQNE
ncbi:hypothetical protein AAG906_013087 [Vitis piasezkii]